MQAWHDALKADGIDFLADGSGVYARAMGLETDLSENGLGVRVKRFVMIAEDGVVEYLALEPPGGKITVTGAEDVLTHL